MGEGPDDVPGPRCFSEGTGSDLVVAGAVGVVVENEVESDVVVGAGAVPSDTHCSLPDLHCGDWQSGHASVLHAFFLRFSLFDFVVNVYVGSGGGGVGTE